MEDPVETSELLAFARVVEGKSVSRAAATLGVPRATISRRLARLEHRLGARLLRRTTRSLTLTDAGDALYRHARIVLDAVQLAEASVRRSDDRVIGDLRVSVPPAMSAGFSELVCAFATRFPDVRVHVHYASRFVDLQRDGYDVAIRAAWQLEPGLIARKLAEDRAVGVASPRYLAAHGTPTTKRDLAHHRCLMGFSRGEVPQTHWPWGKTGQVAIAGAMFTNQIPLLLEAAVRDQGIAIVPAFLANPALEAGLVVRVLPGLLEMTAQISIVYAERELQPPQVRAFVDAVVAWGPNAFAEPAAQCVERVRRRKS